jgi:hypothetical protein
MGAGGATNAGRASCSTERAGYRDGGEGVDGGLDGDLDFLFLKRGMTWSRATFRVHEPRKSKGFQEGGRELRGWRVGGWREGGVSVYTRETTQREG